MAGDGHLDGSISHPTVATSVAGGGREPGTTKNDEADSGDEIPCAWVFFPGGGMPDWAFPALLQNGMQGRWARRGRGRAGEALP